MKAASKPAKPVRTPKVSENNLKKFSGKYTDWAAQRSEFVAKVMNTVLDVADKIGLLTDALEKEAARCAGRAENLDLLMSLAVEDFMAAFGRFTLRKGCCMVLFSDNGSTFPATDRELARVLEHWARTLPEHQLAKYGTKLEIYLPCCSTPGRYLGGSDEATSEACNRRPAADKGPNVPDHHTVQV